MSSTVARIGWAALSVFAAFCLGTVALSRGETISAVWLVSAAVSVFFIAYRFYARYIATRALQVDPTRATPAWRRNDGLDYVPTEKPVLFGHHFAAIAGAGPLVGPVLAAQMGYLPGTIWIIVGVIFGQGLFAFVAFCLGMLAARIAPSRRRVVGANLYVAFRHLPHEERRQLLHAHFRALGRGVFETAIAWWSSDARIRNSGVIEGLALALVFVAVGVLSLSGYLPFAYIIMPPLLWAAVALAVAVAGAGAGAGAVAVLAQRMGVGCTGAMCP